MDEESFSLSWNDFEFRLTRELDALRADDDAVDLLDVTLATEDDLRLKAHRVVLAASSPYFRRLLRVHFSGVSRPVVFLKGVQGRHLDAILNFVYKGEVAVGQSDLNAFLNLAEEFQIQGLSSAKKPKTKTKPKPKTPPKRPQALNVVKKQSYSLVEKGTTKKSALVMADGFGYVKNNARGSRVYWKCRMYKSRKCKAAAILDQVSNHFFATGIHTCHNEEASEKMATASLEETAKMEQDEDGEEETDEVEERFGQMREQLTVNVESPSVEQT